MNLPSDSDILDAVDGHLIRNRRKEAASYKYTICHVAYNRLHELLCPVQPTNRSRAYRATLHTQRVYFNGSTYVHDIVDDQSISNPHLEGLSHSLSILSRSYDLQDWQDARPEYIANQHEQKIAPPPDMFYTIKDAKEYYELVSHHTYEAPWRPQIYVEDLKTIEKDPTPWGELSTNEQLSRLRIKELQTMHVARLFLSPAAREYYYKLALHYQMAPRSKMHNMTAYISAALEAIGFNYLAPPVDAIETILELPNKRKARAHAPLDNSRYTTKGHKRVYGNHDHTPWDPKPVVSLPTDMTRWKQIHIDYCLKYGLADLVPYYLEAVPDSTLDIPLKYRPTADLDPTLDTQGTVHNTTSSGEATPPPVRSGPSITRNLTPLKQAQIEKLSSIKPDEIEEAYNLYLSGTSTKDLALIYECTQTTIRRYINRRKYSNV